MHLIKTLTAFTLVLSFTCCRAYSQRDTTHSGLVYIAKADVLLPVMGLFENHGYFSLTFEVCFKNRHSVQLTGFISDYDYSLEIYGSGSNYHKKKENTFQFIPEYKFFISRKKNYSGFYSGAYFKWLKHSLTDQVLYDDSLVYSSLKYKDEYIGGGIIFGYQNYFKKRWVFDILIGYGIRTRISKDIKELVNTQLAPDSPTSDDGRAAINIGYRF